MPIKILSPQLANQIAAGEVVERPASVVKELVENSLDAGANKIQIDIENGGANLIRIRDNGCGIPKEELSLALARHATSKIADLDDLEAILSLGFRGEALASISSVSRLTLTSRTEAQTEAWQVYAQGRDMETTIKPASHPVGTTVEVANLFFNTPARRKFLRTDKTEFAHIDEVIRRIALTKFNTAFTLTHNGKIIRQYRPAEALNQQLKRVAAICGDDFVKNALRIDWKHDDLHLSGWVATPNFSRTQNDLSYCYINGRMVRDKVVSHAIRQAYAQYLPTDVYPAFVLFIDLNPHDVDVNVHPTKHEVRFHQQRLIHDFIYEGISYALNNQEQLNWHTDQSAVENHEENTVREPQPNYSIRPNRAAAGQNIFAPQYHEKPQQNQPHFSNTPVLPNHVSTGYRDYRSDAPSKTEQRLYGELLRTLPPTEQKDISNTAQQNISDTAKIISTEIIECSSHLRALSLIENRALLLQQNQDFFLLSLAKLQHLQWQLALQQIHIEQQPLLIPIVFRLTESQFQTWQQYSSDFKKIGFEFIENQAQLRLTLNKVPSVLRTQNLQKCVMAMLTRDENSSPFLTALCAQLECKTFDALADSLNLLSETERLLTQVNRTAFTQLLKPVNWQPLLDEI